jgi:hypothetical protein
MELSSGVSNGRDATWSLAEARRLDGLSETAPIERYSWALERRRAASQER